MKRKRHVAVLAFADSASKPLPGLEEEAERVQQILQDQEADTRLYPVPYPRMSLEKIARVVREKNWRIRIFHFAGHAKGTSLQFTDLSIAFGSLGRLLADKMGTQLVFLNGCGTQSLVAPLLAAGIPAVIATQAAVGDERASKFAVFFYEALADGQTLEESFRYAGDVVGMLSPQSGEPAIRCEVMRHMAFEPPPAETIPWRLYLNPGFEKAPEWKLRGDRRLILRRRMMVNWGLGLLVSLSIFLMVWMWPGDFQEVQFSLMDQNEMAFSGVALPYGYHLVMERDGDTLHHPLREWDSTIRINSDSLSQRRTKVYLEKNGKVFSDPDLDLASGILREKPLAVAVMKMTLGLNPPSLADSLPEKLVLHFYQKFSNSEFFRFSDTMEIDLNEQVLEGNDLIIREFVPWKVYEEQADFLTISCITPNWCSSEFVFAPQKRGYPFNHNGAFGRLFLCKKP